MLEAIGCKVPNKVGREEGSGEEKDFVGFILGARLGKSLLAKLGGLLGSILGLSLGNVLDEKLGAVEGALLSTLLGKVLMVSL